MTFTWFSVAVLLIVATSVASGMISGAKKGFAKAFASFISLIASLLISLVVSPRISQIFGEAILGFIKTQEFYGTLIPRSVYVDLLLTAVASMVISSVFFLVVLAVLNLILSFAFNYIYSGMQDKTKLFSAVDAPSYEKNSKTWGAALGAISGLVAVIIMLAPVTGSLRVAGTVVDMVDKADPNFFIHPEARSAVNDFKKYTNDSVSMVLYQMGGEVIYTAAASATVNGETIYVVHELESIEVLLNDFLVLYPAIQDPLSVTEEQSDKIESLCVHMNDSKSIDILMAEFLPQAASAWLRGEIYMLVPKPTLNPLISPAFDRILQICASSDVYTVKENTVSLLRIYSIILESGILRAGDDFDAIIACIQGSDLIARLEAEIDKNPHMALIKDYISEIAMRALANEIYNGDLGAILGENYELLTSKIAEAIEIINNKGYGTIEEKIDAMTIYAQEYLGDYGLSIPSSLAKPIAEVMFSGVGSQGEVSAEDIQSFLQSYLTN